LANAFGVKPGLELANAFGVKPGLELVNAFRSNPELELANAFRSNPELELANAFGVFKPVLLTFHVDPTLPRYGTDLIQPEAADPESTGAIC